MLSRIRILLIVLLGACVDPYEVPKSVSSSNLLVVEGRLTNDSSYINLSRTSNLDSLVTNPVVGALVGIEDESGNPVATLSSNGRGRYYSDNNLNFDKKYRIRILTEEDEYLSELVEMIETPAIDSVSLKLSSDDSKLEFLLTTHDSNSEPTYFKWDYTETYQYASTFPSLLKFSNGELLDREAADQIYHCWINENSTEINIGSTRILSENLVSNRLIVSHSPNQNIKFSIGYSLLVKQYSLSEEEFQFWDLLRKNTETLGTLFDPQPSQLLTNFLNISGKSQDVIGFVGASSVSEMRINVSYRDIKNVYQTDYSKCEKRTISYNSESIFDEYASGEIVPLYYEIGIGTFGADTIGVTGIKRSCADCRLQGGSNVKPDYWFN